MIGEVKDDGQASATTRAQGGKLRTIIVAMDVVAIFVVVGRSTAL